MEAKIIQILEEIQPEDFVWTDPTTTEMVKFKAIFRAGMQEVIDFCNAHKLSPGNVSIPGKAWQDYLKKKGLK